MSQNNNKPPKPDPNIIDAAPIEPSQPDFTSDESEHYLALIGELGAENASLKAELDKLKAKRTVDETRARLMEPYANKVFWFLVWYCIAIFLVLMLDGFSLGGFDVSEVVLGVIAGSTAVSAIGLVGFVVSGLFNARRHED